MLLIPMLSSMLYKKANVTILQIFETCRHISIQVGQFVEGILKRLISIVHIQMSQPHIKIGKKVGIIKAFRYCNIPTYRKIPAYYLK